MYQFKDIARGVLLVALLGGAENTLAVDFEQAMQAFEQQDYQRAGRLLGELAATGDADAQYLLGRLYAAGNGVIQDYVEAHKWFNLAASGGHRQAAQARDDIADRMTATQIAEAQRRASGWRVAVVNPVQVTEPGDLEGEQVTATAIADIQQLLNQLDYDAGPVDGVIGQRTEQAIRDYQADAGLPVDGQPSKVLLARLQEEQNLASTRSVLPGQTLQERWPRLVWRDTFADNDYSEDPRWQVANGEFSVEAGIGLRSAQQPPRRTRQASGADLDDPKEIGLSILQAVLEQATGQAQTDDSDDASYGEIYLAEPFSDSFALQLALTSRQSEGSLELGPYQGADRRSGYRLVYTPGAAAGLALLRLSSSGSSVVETSSRPLDLEDGRQHTLSWTRDETGTMRVTVDGRELIRAKDRAFGEDFSGFVLINHGGDYAVREIELRESE